MSINKVIIVCFKKDVFLLRSCIASVKYWHPETTVYLLKDKMHGDFDTSEIEKVYGAKIFETEREKWGWGWAKIGPFIHDEAERYLVLDSDTVLAGRVLDKLSAFSEDFIVTGVKTPDAGDYNVNTHYLVVDKVKELNPDYKYPGYVFNSGQMIVTGGFLKKEDFGEILNMGTEIKCKYPQYFKYNDQGVLNYVLTAAKDKKEYTVRYDDFWMWPGLPEINSIDIKNITDKKGYPYIIHWAGLKPVDFRKFARYDILEFFNNEYYKHVKFGALKQAVRFYKKVAYNSIRILSYKLRGIKYN